ncbi:MAG: MBL fold metallo-hydrolase [Solirubrobacteraceae bacterium]|nr:MBL fold metallo-hydrolase [Solirubrobacteraceae bacterium]
MADARGNLTVLGCSPSWQNVGEACTSFLVDAPGTRMLIDCGNGAFSKLRERCDYLSVDAIAITHTHGDHILDLLPFAYALLYSPRALKGESRRPRLLLPPGSTDRLRAIFDLIDRAELLDLAYDVEEYDPAVSSTVGSLTLDFAPVPHFVPTHAVRVSTEAGGRLVFGADHRPCQKIIDFATGADVLLLEATLLAPEEGVRGHITSVEAAEIALAAGVGQLVLTHMSDELPREQLVAQAAALHPDTALAVPGATYTF